MSSKRTRSGDAYSDTLFRPHFSSVCQPGDGDPDFNDGVIAGQTGKGGFVEGSVVTSYPESMTVDVESDIGSIAGCRIGSPYISPLGAGDSAVPEPGTRCLVCVEVTPPVIVCFVAEPSVADDPADDSKLSAVTKGTEGFGGQDPTYAQKGGSNFRGGRTDQLIPGDRVLSAPEGNLIAALRGISVLKGSELSQIIATSLGGLLRMVSNLFQHYHAAGSTVIENQNGETSMTLTVGSTSRDNGEVAPQFKVTIGAKGGLIEALITSEDGEKLARLHADPEGNVEVELPSLDVEVEGDVDTEVGGDASTEITGSLSVSADQNVSLRVGQAASVETDSFDVAAGSFGKVKTTGDLSLQSGGRLLLQIAKEATLRSGAYEHKAEASALSLASTAGDVRMAGLTLKPAGTIDLTGTKSAVIGGEVSTEIKGKSVDLGSGPLRLPVLRTSDMEPLAQAILSYISLVGVSAPPKVTVPPLPPGANPVAALANTLGSKIVRSA